MNSNSNHSSPYKGEVGRGSYKRGTITKNGKRYGFYPDGSLYRIYNTEDRPFTEWVDVEGETFLRVRQATEQGYTDCPVFGCCDLAYPTSTLRRSRTVGGGQTRQCPYMRTAVACFGGTLRRTSPKIERKSTQ